MQPEISYATLEDAPAVAEIHVKTWREAYKEILPPDLLASLSVEKREAWWRKVIHEKTSELLVARRNGLVEGWINFGASRDERSPNTEAEIMALYVSPAAWSSGTGRALWLRAKDIIVQEGYMTCSLWVFPQNSRAIKFYRAAGFALTASSLKQFELGQTKLEEVRYACIVDR